MKLNSCGQAEKDPGIVPVKVLLYSALKYVNLVQADKEEGTVPVKALYLILKCINREQPDKDSGIKIQIKFSIFTCLPFFVVIKKKR